MKKLATAIAMTAIAGTPTLAHDRPLGDGKTTDPDPESYPGTLFGG